MTICWYRKRIAELDCCRVVKVAAEAQNLKHAEGKNERGEGSFLTARIHSSCQDARVAWTSNSVCLVCTNHLISCFRIAAAYLGEVVDLASQL